MFIVEAVWGENLAIYSISKQAEMCYYYTKTKSNFCSIRMSCLFLAYYNLLVLHRLDWSGPFHKIMTVSNEKFDYILKHRVCINIAVDSK